MAIFSVVCFFLVALIYLFINFFPLKKRCFYGVGRDFFKTNLLLNKILICYSRSIIHFISESVKNFTSLLLFRFYFVCLFVYLFM